MNRRDFLRLSAIGMAGSIAPQALFSGAPTSSPADNATMFDHYFLKICEGYLGNCVTTSGDFAVCDFPEGTKVKGCLTPSGKTYPSVARMLPAIAEWVAAGKSPQTFGRHTQLQL